MGETIETNDQIIKRIEERLDTFGEIYYIDREYWTGGQILQMEDAENDLNWLIQRAKTADLLAKEFIETVQNEKILRRKARRIKRAREFTHTIQHALKDADPKLKEIISYEFEQLRRILDNHDKKDNMYNS
ncbi:hypothetical protein KLEB273_gp204 [Bacillus phage vB_BauM_KLEB27-3]|nr:hypothetical protein KLEB273_gp204 [Bacillus phage vB_BauM_KLEB27-3]